MKINFRPIHAIRRRGDCAGASLIIIHACVYMYMHKTDSCLIKISRNL